MNPILALIIANIIWGAASPIFKFSLTNVPPFTLAFLRFFLAALIFIPFLKGFSWTKVPMKTWCEMIAASFFGITINISFFFLGIQQTASINAPIIGSAAPLFLFLLSVLFLKEKIKYKVMSGMFVSLLGVLLIIFAPLIFEGKTAGALTELRGNLLLIVATFGALLHPLFIKNPLKKISPFVIVFFTFLFGSMSFLPFMMQELHQWSFSQLNFAGSLGIIYGALFSSALAYLLYFYGLSKIHVQEVGLFGYVDPVVSILVAAPLLHEYPTVHFFMGTALVFLGIFISEGRFPYHPFHLLFHRKHRRS